MADTKVESKLRESKREINEDKRLSEADLDSYVEHGFVLLRGLLSAEEVELVLADLPEMVEYWRDLVMSRAGTRMRSPPDLRPKSESELVEPEGARICVRRWPRSLPVGGVLEECTAEPGDVIVYDSDMVHGPSANVVGPDRQALRLHIEPTVPLEPAEGFEDMSAIEKSQSVPYLRQRFGEHFRFTNPAISDSELTGGFGPVTTCDFLRLGGRTFGSGPALMHRR